MSLTLYMQDLEEAIDEEGLERLQKNVNKSENFRSSLELFHCFCVGHFQETILMPIILPFLCLTTIFLNLTPNLLICMFPICLVTNILFVFRKGFLLILLLVTLITLRRCVSILLNYILAHLLSYANILRSTNKNCPSKMEQAEYWSS